MVSRESFLYHSNDSYIIIIVGNVLSFCLDMKDIPSIIPLAVHDIVVKLKVEYMEGHNYTRTDSIDRTITGYAGQHQSVIYKDSEWILLTCRTITGYAGQHQSITNDITKQSTWMPHLNYL